MKPRTRFTVALYIYITLVLFSSLGLFLGENCSPPRADEGAFKGADGQVASVIVDGAVGYQTIEGWGITAHVYAPWTKTWPPNYPIPFPDVAKEIKGLGYDYAMVLHPPEEVSNDDRDPFHYNWISYNKQFGKHFLYFERAKALQDAGLKLVVVEYNYNVMDWATDGPAYNLPNNHIRSSDSRIYEEVAEYWTALLHYAQNNYGLTFDYISLQNEPGPDGIMTYWSPAELTAGIKAVASRLQQEDFNTKILAPEDASASGSENYLQTILQDPVAGSCLFRGAFHGYATVANGKADNAISGFVDLAQDNLVRNRGLALWMTEWAFGTTQIDKVLEYSKMIYNAQVYGNATNYFVWSATAHSEDGIFADSVTDGMVDVLKYGRALSQYTRYIRPGAKRISATVAGTNDLYVTAFKHEANHQFTVEAINKGKAEHTVTFAIRNQGGISKLDVIRTSSYEDAVNLGSILVNKTLFVYALRKESVTTFTGTISAGEALPCVMYFPQVVLGGGYSMISTLVCMRVWNNVGNVWLRNGDTGTSKEGLMPMTKRENFGATAGLSGWAQGKRKNPRWLAGHFGLQNAACSGYLLSARRRVGKKSPEEGGNHMRLYI
ncbi:MAG: hypothetical protein LAP85_05965 [Acidobacteriia bacterium]|nr:hypothetical protein [Terriglobia bacterium]